MTSDQSESPIILASASPRRRELLAALIQGFAVLPSDIPEPLLGDPIENARQLALAKAEAIADTHPGAVVIGSDTIVHVDGESFGKPADAEDAVRTWLRLRGRQHRVTSAVAVISGSTRACETDTTEVLLQPLTKAQIRAYVASGRPMDKAGAYAIQDEDVPTVESYVGCYCGIMGLPLWLTKDLLTAAGVHCTSPETTFARCAACPSRPNGGTRPPSAV